MLDPEDLLKGIDDIGTQPLKRKTTREELLEKNSNNISNNSGNSLNMNIANMNGIGMLQFDSANSNSNVINGLMGIGGGLNMNMNGINDNGMNMSNIGFPTIMGLDKMVSKTPEPLERIRSDCLVHNSSQ